MGKRDEACNLRPQLESGSGAGTLLGVAEGLAHHFTAPGGWWSQCTKPWKLGNLNSHLLISTSFRQVSGLNGPGMSHVFRNKPKSMGKASLLLLFNKCLLRTISSGPRGTGG